MSFTLRVPQPPLNQFIECLWHVDLQVPYTREKILPTSSIELIINFGPPHRKYNTAETDFNLMKDSWIAGFQTGFIVNEPVAETLMVGVRFKPGGAYPFLGLPILEITDYVLDLDHLWGPFAAELRERLMYLNTVADQFSLLEKILMSRLKDDRSSIPAVDFAISNIFSAGGNLSLRDLSHDIGISQKHLNHQFKKTVGVSPKQLSRIVKFQHVLNQINPAVQIDWSEIAYDCHYYDQSHFNRDFASFTGMSPTAYVSFRQSLLEASPVQGQDVHFVPIIG
ncbi:MAG: helix-turn-helix transcriptional regulator [Chloroflexota bacterium]